MPTGEAAVVTRPVHRRAWVGIAGFVLGAGYALFVRFYHAAGRDGFGTMASEAALEARWASYQAGLLILVGAVACPVLTRPELRMLGWWARAVRGREVPPPIMVVICAVPTTAGGIFAIGHGAGQIIGSLLELAGFGVASVFADTSPHTTEELLWGITFYGPWFLAMGLCLVWSAVIYLEQSEVPAPIVRVITTLIALLGVLSSLFFLLAVMLHWEWTAE